jgi:catechol 2,3-dioxygenase-like lactoylglutathione lyase family enzyme
MHARLRSPMLEIRQIDHLVLRVRDIEAMESFYCRVLGTTVERRRHDLGMLHLRAGTAQIDLIAIDGQLGRMGGAAPGKDGRNVDHFCLRVEPFDVEAIVAHLKANGVAVGEIRPRFGAGGTGVSIYLTDPEGNTVELKGPPQE